MNNCSYISNFFSETVGCALKSFNSKNLDLKTIFDHPFDCIDCSLTNSVLKSRNPFIKKLDLNEKFIIQYSGNFGRMHDITTILKTAKLIKNKNIIFLFIGNGSKRKEIVDNILSQLDFKHSH